MTPVFALILLIIQFVILIFIGGFARTTQILNPSSTFLTQNLLFIFAWTLMNSPYKRLTLFSITVMLIIIAVTFESNLLFGRFWYSIFNSFQASYELTAQILSECCMAIFAIILICIDYIGIFRYWQIYLIIVPVVNFGWSFNYCVLRYGLQIFDSCGGLTIFAFSGVVTIAMWVVSVRGNHHRYGGYNSQEKDRFTNTDIYRRQQYYNGYTISLYGGLIGTFLMWPSFNASTSTLSSSLLIVNATIKNNIIFKNTAWCNTILALSMGTCLSFMLINRDGTKEQKLKIRSIIDCFINAGIICASFMDLTYNPAAVMSLSLLSTVITLVLYWYYQSLQLKPNKLQSFSNFMILLLHFSRALFRILLPLLGIIVTAIVVSTRKNSTIQLLDTITYGDIYSKTAGLEIVAYFITVVIALVVGIITGVLINCYMGYKQTQLQNKQALESKQGSKIIKPKNNKQETIVRSAIQSSGQQRQKQNLTPIVSFQTARNHVPSGYLSDLNFLELNEQSQQIFPLFLQPEDEYIDEEQTARKLLKEVILSHVKSDYVNNNNIVNMSKMKQRANVNSNTKSQIQKSNRFETDRKSLRNKNDYAIDQEFVLRNNYNSRLSRQTGIVNNYQSRFYVNELAQKSPLKQNAVLKDQRPEIKHSKSFENLQKNRLAQKQRQTQRDRQTEREKEKQRQNQKLMRQLSEQQKREKEKQVQIKKQKQKQRERERERQRQRQKQIKKEKERLKNSLMIKTNKEQQYFTLNDSKKESKNIRQVENKRALQSDLNKNTQVRPTKPVQSNIKDSKEPISNINPVNQLNSVSSLNAKINNQSNPNIIRSNTQRQGLLKKQTSINNPPLASRKSLHTSGIQVTVRSPKNKNLIETNQNAGLNKSNSELILPPPQNKELTKNLSTNELGEPQKQKEVKRKLNYGDDQDFLQDSIMGLKKTESIVQQKNKKNNIEDEPSFILQQNQHEYSEQSSRII